MKNAAVIIGPASRDLGNEIAGLLGLEGIKARLRTFPDGESLCRADVPEGLDVAVIVQGTHPPQDTHLQQLYQLVDVCRHAKARRIVCVTPYLAYSRQDKRASKDEPASAQVVLQGLATAGAHDLLTLEVHNSQIFESAPLRGVSLGAEDLIIPWLAGLRPRRPVLISPDRGGAARVSAAAQRLSWPVIQLDKQKSDERGTWYEGDAPDFTGQDVFVLDDLCSSGSTLKPLAAFLRRHGARKITFAVVHFFPDVEALSRQLGGADIVFTDAVPLQPAVIRSAGAIAVRLGQLLADAKDLVA